ncbi:LysM peptidoglycan-binding domain-containing protein [candidate division KSB1 bacterium]|nr:LysM peptidoglycan-binding domain-containing protein [candidate division KSB1 bacterium]
MKIKGQLLVLLSVTAILLFLFSGLAMAQEEESKLKMDEYKAELAGYETREAEAGAKIAALESENAALKAEIEATQIQIDAEWETIYAAIGVSKEEVEDYRSNLGSIDSQIDGLAELSPEELFRNRDEICEIAARIEEAKGQNPAILSEMQEKLAALDGKLANLKAKVPANIFDQYSVVKGDYLWKISKKDEIYGDALQWIRIYCVNKDQIKDPDLIQPEQVLNIARGVGQDEYLVVKGEWLSRIAGYAKVYNDPTKWTKLYEANKDVISDPSLVYPHQVIQIPQD